MGGASCHLAIPHDIMSLLITHETDVLISLRFLAWKHALKLTHVECIRTKQNGGRKIMALTTAHAAQAAIVLSRCVLAVLNGWRKKAHRKVEPSRCSDFSVLSGYW